MKRIKDFSSFINESFLLEKSLSQNGVSVFVIKAGASKTSLTPTLQKKLGVNGSTIYSVTLDNLGRLYNLWDYTFETNKKWNSLLTNKLTGVNFKTSGKSKVKDYFKINGFEIKDSGEFTIKKSDLSGPISIEVSGNGILVLTRLCHAIFEIVEKSAGNIGNDFLQKNENWEIQIVLGGDPKTGENRGYRYFYYTPGYLTPFRNIISHLISVSSLRYQNPGLNKIKDLRQYRFPGIDSAWWINDICKDTESSSTKSDLNSSIPLVMNRILNKIRLSLIGKKFLVSDKDIDITTEWNRYAKGISGYFRETNEKINGTFNILAFNTIGAKEANNLHKSIVEKIAISDSLLNNNIRISKDFISIIKEGSIRDLSNSEGFSFDYIITSNQRPIRFEPAKDKATQIMNSQISQEEGEF